MRLRFHKYYGGLAGLLLILEIFIAWFMHDQIIRPYVGDFLATILLYCLVRSFFTAPTKPVVLAVLLVSYGIEAAQYFHLLKRLGLTDFPLARIIFGTAFEWSDMLAYTLGAGLILAVEETRTVKRIREGA